MKHVLVTGAPSLVGAEVVAHLAADPEIESLHLLVGKPSEPDDEKELDRLRGVLSPTATEPRFVFGHLAAPRFGLSLDDWRRLGETLDTVFHLAELPDLQADLTTARLAHVRPVETWLRFLRDFPRVRLHHLSTGFVGGTRRGLLTEFDLDCEQEFHNPWERSRFEAETRLRESSLRDRITVYRPSHVVGSTDRGRAFARGGSLPLWTVLASHPAWVPADPEARLDVVSSDFVAEGLLALARRSDSPGRTYHLAAGWHASWPVARWLERLGPGNGSRPLPRVATPLVRLAGGLSGGRLGTRDRDLEGFRPYLQQTCVFDTFLARKGLEGSGIAPPNPEDLIVETESPPLMRKSVVFGSSTLSDRPRAARPTDPVFQEKQYHQVGRYKVAYRDIGEGEPVVFLHGFSGAESWDGVVNRLRGRYRCLVVETLGLGDTEAPLDADYSLPAQAAMVRGLLSALELESVHLVGHDTGGAIAQLLAVRWPFLAETLVLSDCDAFDNWPPAQVERMRTAMRIPGVTHLLVALLRIPAIARTRLGFARMHHDGSLLTRERIREYLPETSEEVRRLRRFFLSLDPSCTREIEHLLQDLDTPTLIVWGCEDAYWSTSWARKLYEEIPGAERLELIPFAGLSCQEENPDRFAEVLAEFLGDHPLGS